MTTEHDTTKQGHLLRVCVASLLGPLGAFYGACGGPGYAE